MPRNLPCILKALFAWPAWALGELLGAASGRGGAVLLQRRLLMCCLMHLGVWLKLPCAYSIIVSEELRGFFFDLNLLVCVYSTEIRSA